MKVVIFLVSFAYCLVIATGLCQKIIVPAYFGSPNEWQNMTEGASIAVMNPDSGPGARKDQTYVDIVNKATQKGVVVIGYSHTSYGQRDINTVKSEVDLYKSWYGVVGIFFDEVATSSAELSYYTQLYDYVRNNGGVVVINPGTVPDEAYLKVADHLCVFEDSYSKFQSYNPPAWLKSAPPSKVYHIVYEVQQNVLNQTLAKSQSLSGGYVYLTNRSLGSNPYLHLPEYWTTEVTLTKSSC